ncbi:hypothetical protein YC2023_068263 [Brassica napus]
MNRRALCLEPDKNKQCNLAICLMRMGRIPEAKSLIDAVRDSSAEIEFGDELFTKSYDRAGEMKTKLLETQTGTTRMFLLLQHLLDKRERGSVGPRMDETGPYLLTEKVDQLQSSDTRERKVVLLQLGL